MKLHHLPVIVLLYGLATIWVPGRWPVFILESAVFLCTLVFICWCAWRRLPMARPVVVLPVGAMALWGGIQLMSGWTVVKADTQQAVLYWLAAASLVWIGCEACANGGESFLKGLLLSGSAICLLGLVQLLTSNGRVFWLFPSGYNSQVIGPFLSPNNYAAFVELLLPVALFMALRRPTQLYAYSLLASVLLASVVASGSRAGSALVIAESIVVFLFCPRLGVRARQQRTRLLVAFASLASVFVVILGYELLWKRLSHSAESYLIRREFLESSVAMFRASPVHGLGLGTWPSSYPRFAIADTGLDANHSHNEWIQWAAEGGLPALFLMVTVLVWTLQPAAETVWGIGVPTVMIHSLVDYPFFRLGLAAWLFVLVGAMAACRRGLPRIAIWHPLRGWPRPVHGTVAIGLSFALVVGTFVSSKLAWADILFEHGTADGTSRAARLWPSRAEYQFALSEVDPANTVDHLTLTLQLEPTFTKARIDLAILMELRGSTALSEQLLLDAAHFDRQFPPAWALANFYFRHSQQREFWLWARRAAQISTGNLNGLFDLCSHMSDSGHNVLEYVVGDEPRFERQFLAYLLEQGRLPEASIVALRIAKHPEREDYRPLLSFVDSALDAGQATPAGHVWDALCAKSLLPYRPGMLVNGNFSRPMLNYGFDWRLQSTEGVNAAQLSTADGPSLELNFSGREPEAFELLSQIVRVVSGARYVIRFQYRTVALPGQTGLYWSLGPGREYPLDASGAWASREWRFRASGDLEHLRFKYHRLLGTTRIEGKVLLQKIQLDPDQS